MPQAAYAHAVHRSPETGAAFRVSALGLAGITAYFGLLDVGRPVAGETVVVRMWAGSRRLCRFLAVLAIVGVSGCSASGPETALETAYSAVGAQVK